MRLWPRSSPLTPPPSIHPCLHPPIHPSPHQTEARRRLTAFPRRIIRSTRARAVLVFPALAATDTLVSNKSLVSGKPLSAPAKSRSPFQSCRLV